MKHTVNLRPGLRLNGTGLAGTLVLMLAAAAWTGSTVAAQTADQAATPAAAPAHPDPYVPPAKRRPAPKGASGPELQAQALQKLQKRFEEADLDASGSLNKEEAHRAGLRFVEKNFEHIDTTHRGLVSFEDVKTYIMQRREEALSR